jgi:Pentapeptide repeats (8 copies)
MGATAASCTPGSGPDLAGRHLTSSDLSSYSSGLQCANLTGADLSGLSLAQVNFAGATGVPPYSLYLLIVAGSFSRCWYWDRSGKADASCA